MARLNLAIIITSFIKINTYFINIIQRCYNNNLSKITEIAYIQNIYIPTVLSELFEIMNSSFSIIQFNFE